MALQSYGTLSPTKQQTTVSLLTKNAERREKFKKIGQAIAALKTGDPNVNDYHTGRESSFHIASGDSHDPLLHSMPLGPAFKTPQWVRGVE